MSFEDTETVISCYQKFIQQQAQARPTLEYLEENVFLCGGPTPKSLIEISGASGSGKSLLLSHLMARCLAPHEVGGKQCEIIFIDLGHKFNVRHFLSQITRVICDSGIEFSSMMERDVVLESCMNSMTILSCFSVEEFDLAFDVVKDILFENRKVALVAVDNLDALYWLDEQKKLTRMHVHYANIIDKLRKICEKHNVSCAYTVNSNYLDMTNTVPNKLIVKIDYELKLNLLADERNVSLNGKNIVFDGNGIHFDK